MDWLAELVIEARDLIGGGVMTEELTLPGFKHNTHSYMHSYIFRGPVYDELELEKNGAKYIFPDEIYAGLLPDGRSLIVYRDVERTIKEIAKFSKHDAEGWRYLYEKFHKFRDVLISYFFSPAAPPSAFASVLETTEEGLEVLQMLLSTTGFVMDDYFENDEVKAIIYILNEQSGLVHHVFGAGVFFPLFTTEMHEPRMMGHAVGGSIQLSLAMGKVIEQNGGEIRINSEIVKIIVEDGTAKGVELKDGTKIMADVIASNLRAKDLLINKVGEEHVEEKYIRRVKRIRAWEHTLFTPHWALNDAIQWKAAETNADVMKCPSVGICETLEIQERQYNNVRMGEVPFENLSLIVECPTVIDPTQAPPGKHTAFAWVFTPNYQFEKREGSYKKWLDIKEEFADAIDKKVSEYANNFNKDNILARFADSPYDHFRNLSFYPDWECMGGHVVQDQMGYFRPFIGGHNYRMPVKNLYMCGPSAHPGGGCTGANGYLCANAIAEDRKIKKWWKVK